MQITEKTLREMIRRQIEASLKEAVTDTDKELSQDWVKFVDDVDSFVMETIEKAKDLVAFAEDIQEKEIAEEPPMIKDRKAKEYELVRHRMNFVKNLITKLSSVDFDASESYYKGKV